MVWESLTAVNTDVGLCGCRFVGTDVICTVNYRGKGHLCRWKQVTEGLFKYKLASAAVPAAITGMDMNSSGELAALVNAEGHTLIMDTTKLRTSYQNKKAHMVFGTDVAFADDTEAYVSVSGDASARVTVVPQQQSGFGFRLLLLLILALLCAAYLYRDHEQVAPYAEMVQKTVNALVSDVSNRIGAPDFKEL